MNRIPKISVIVPVYKVENYLNECVDSILNQTFGDFELILVDDGSPDNCPAICDGYALKDERVKVLHKANGGPMSACNLGLKNAIGEYVCFIDGDDFVDVKYFETFISALKDDTDMVCMSGVKYWNKNKYYLDDWNSLEAGEYTVDNKILSRVINNDGTGSKIIGNSRGAKLTRTEIVKKYAAYCSEEVRYGEDTQFTVGIITGCKKIVVLKDYKYFYRQNVNSIVHTYKQNLFSEGKILYRTITSIPDISSVENFENQLNTWFLFRVIECLKNEYYYKRLNRKNFEMIVNDEYTQAALKDYQNKNMGRFSRWMIDALKRNSLHRAKRSMFIFAIYCKLRGIDYK